jgi:hypothetical protein
MAKYRMEGTIVDTARASANWEEDTRWNGNNHISVATASQFEHEKLYRSRKGRYYVEHTSQWQGSTPRAEWVSPEEAAQWLLANGHELPADLQAIEDAVTE